MDAEQSSGSNASDAKKQKRNDEAGPSEISAVDTSNPAEVVAIEQTGDIFKLDIDCFEEVFDYLRLRQLVPMSKTCKRLQAVAGYCFQQNYLGYAHCNSKAILSGFDRSELGFNLIPFVRILKIHHLGYQFFISVRSKLRRLKEIHCMHLNAVEMNYMKGMFMNNLEVLRVTNCDLGNNFHEILNKCTKLRRLIVENCGGEFNWIDRKYPTLEYFKLKPPSASIASIEGPAMFLKINPNIRKFATSAKLLWKLLWKNRDIVSANGKLDDLAICFNIPMDAQWQSIFDLLNTLYEHGFYKKLQLYFERMSNQEQVNRLATLNGLNKLGFLNRNNNALDFSGLNIEELYICANTYTSDAEMLSTALINLKRIHFEWASINEIVPFIRRSVKMHRIKINHLQNAVHLNKDTKAIDLRALNREREQLSDAVKITLFVEEDIYLATKWALGDTDFSLIRLKRDTSFDWFHDFEY